MANFGDLKTMEGMRSLNEFLATRSYIEGYSFTDADKNVFTQLSSPPPAGLYHALRWYNHIRILGNFPVITAAAPAAAAAPAKKDEEDFELFGDDEEEDPEAARIKAERVAAYDARKANKPKEAAKSSVVLEIKPWDDETDLQALERSVRSVAMDGLLWGASKFVPVAFGIKKLQIGCIVEDDKVSIDALSEQLESFEDYVQSVDVAAFNKV